jgi:hypothetical protein
LDDRAVLRYFRNETAKDLLGVVDLKAASAITTAHSRPELWTGVTLPPGCSVEG